MADSAAAAKSTLGQDDRAIADRIVAGDRSAFEELMRRYNRRLYRVARATLRDPAEAEDALQDAYLSAYRNIAQFRGDASLSSWLTRLVLNECLGRMRRTARRQNVISIISPEIPLESLAVFAEESESPDQETGRAQMRDLLERKLDELPESVRLVFVLRSVEELTVEDTAASLGISEEVVRSRHFRARGLLREALAREMDLAEPDIYDFGGVHCDRIVAAVWARLESPCADTEPCGAPET